MGAPGASKAWHGVAGRGTGGGRAKEEASELRRALELKEHNLKESRRLAAAKEQVPLAHPEPSTLKRKPYARMLKL